jgi:hypothetical protein
MFALVLLFAAASSVSPDAARGTGLKSPWVTPAEASDYRRTPRYAETMDWFARLDAASDQLAMEDFGRSPQGRALKVVVLAAGGEFTPEAAHASGKPIIFIQAGIHPGENEGKDALMALSRELTVGGRDAALLQQVILVLVPIFNVDGHERFSPFNRINQNGPEAMGWRSTAQNLNLNRDYTKADAPEMQAWLRLWQRWQPDLLVDMHNTNGADYQYPMTWAFETHQNIAPSLAQWQREVFDGQVKPALHKQGSPVTLYVSLKDHGDLRAGLVEGASSARFSVGYAAAAGRAGLLLETHMLKDFRTRTLVNEALLRELLRAVSRQPQALKSAVAAAERERFAEGQSLPLAFGLSEATESTDFLGYAYTRTPSDVSGGAWVQYDTAKPETFRLPVQREVIVTTQTPAPAAYLLPPQWLTVVERLRLHGIQMQRVDALAKVRASRHRFSKVAWAQRPFEGRHLITELASELETTEVDVAQGSWLITMDQPRARLIAQLLEPDAPDSFIRWGFFDSIFEEKEYAEERVIERIAREMLSADPALKAEFDERLSDPEFAANADARLRFFYERSPYFDQALNRYPVLRLDGPAADALLR